MMFLIKAHYKERLKLLRGNNASRQITQVYSFFDERVQSCPGIASHNPIHNLMSRVIYIGPNVWKMFTDNFDYLPISDDMEKIMFEIFNVPAMYIAIQARTWMACVLLHVLTAVRTRTSSQDSQT